MTEGPRIYNLFPLLAGPIAGWRGHLDRIAWMGFNWIYVNPIHYPGFSGSLYAVKDPDRFHPLLEDAGGDPRSRLRDFLEEAERRGIRVMLDLVVNHTARDALLVERHPDWFQRDDDGEISSPFAVDPDDPSKITVWGDLAELDFDSPGAREGLIEYWSAYIRRQLEIGFSGFRCDAAYKVAAEVWSRLIEPARRVRPGAVFFAETLGCTLDEVAAVASAGFDYLFNSSKWWDFRQPWALSQYEAHRHIAPSISFPETHDTPRLAEEAGGRIEVLRMRYLIAAFFSTGVMIPIGFEHGFRRPLHVVHSRPEDWEQTGIDLREFIRAVHDLKTSVAVLNEEAPMWALPAHGPPARQTPGRTGEGDDGDRAEDAELRGPVVRLMRRSETQRSAAIAWIHPAAGEAEAPADEALHALGVPSESVRIVSSSDGLPTLRDPLGPYECRVLASDSSGGTER